MPPIHLVCALAGAAATVWTYYPGAMSIDSAAQLTEARSLSFSDAHPPFLALLWGVTDRVIPGPGGLLVTQTAVFWYGLYLIARRFTPLVFVVALMPPVFSILGALWKDIMMAGALLVAFGFSSRSKLFWVAIVIACLTRHNAIIAALPLIALHFGWRPLATALASVVLVLLVVASNRVLTERRGYPAQIIALFDLSGIAWVVGEEPDLPPCFRKSNGSVRDSYDPRSVGYLTAKDAPLTYCYSSSDVDDLLLRWWEVVRNRPLAYLRHRARVGFEFLGVHRTPSDYLMVSTNFPPEFFPRLEVDRLQSPKLDRWFRSIETRGVFRPWPYLVVGMLGLALAWFHREWGCVALAASGIAYEAALLLVAPSSDYRYSHWMVTSALVAAVCLAARLWRDVAARRSGRSLLY
ncbi:hypothetical protein K2Z84_28470 [Candidatus Binatia bacterium]|nr:hypothetical protein [Candidatus Binatia bacterium]